MESLVLKRCEPDKETGLIVRKKFQADSGLIYTTGWREFGNLKIIEGVMKGTASIFLVSLMILDENGKLLYDGKIEKFTNYSREQVRIMVREGLFAMLREAAEKQNRNFDELQAYEIIDKNLKTAYYEKSYYAVLEWAKKIGIEIT